MSKINAKIEEKNKEPGHFEFKIGTIKNHISDGTFGRVFEVVCLDNRKIYALKVIRAVERFMEIAELEAIKLHEIERNFSQKNNKIVKIIENFKYGQNYCLVFEKLGLSLYDLLKRNDFFGYPQLLFKSIFKQILEGIDFLHSINIIHTDIKEKINIFRSGYILPNNDSIKIIDFGNSIYTSEYHSKVINTRQYRAPEVILECCEWGKPSDVWGIACTVLEILYGRVYLYTHDSPEHLALIEKSIGLFPNWMIIKSKNNLKNYFEYKRKDFNTVSITFDMINYSKSAKIESINKINKMLKLEDVIKPLSPDLFDLLQQMLKIDPNLRIDCKKALIHRYFRN